METKQRRQRKEIEPKHYREMWLKTLKRANSLDRECETLVMIMSWMCELSQLGYVLEQGYDKELDEDLWIGKKGDRIVKIMEYDICFILGDKEMRKMPLWEAQGHEIKELVFCFLKDNDALFPEK